MAKKTKKLEREWKYCIEPFGHRLKVILTSDVRATHKALGFGDGIHTDMAACIVYHTSDDGLTYMLLNFKAGPGTVAHESWHVVRRMLRGLGAKLENETVAYHLGDLVKKITDFQIDTRKMLRRKGRKK